MKKYAVVFLLTILMSCEQKKSEAVRSNDNSTVIADKNREIDSLKQVISEQNSEKIRESVNPVPNRTDPVLGNQENGTENPQTPILKDLSGKHSLTLHYISWEKPGIITFKKTGENNYSVSGKQEIKNEYVTVDGKIRQISPVELEFEGTIITNTTNDGKCVKTGKQIFLSTKGRKYWRLQNMENCKNYLEYVDIYF